ncbi:Hypothetical predicted protein [Mytilus galloprovincialis]|uniref:DZIP3-like HEPN domain-containing protein n=1 Tax=Mytilus galloprovincialis TaxID=29158 RepID=A0A8B6BMZ4_MYTGA|nr:Hypothetical predicted protein [Mytilus galloprovincialis]
MATASCSSFVDTLSAITNYARLGLVTQNELPNILRELLFIKEPPHLLETHLNNNSYLSINLRAHEWNIIRTVRTNQYDEFDVPLMYKIIRNLNLVPRPTQGWDNQIPPLATEITEGDDIERIRRVRNEIVHRGNTNVQDSELTNYFSIFKDLASRLEVTLMLSNREFVSKIENVETCCIDHDAQQLYIRRLKKLAENETQLAKSVEKVHKDLARQCLKIATNVSKIQEEMDGIKLEQMKVIPMNIRDHMLKDLEQWRKDDIKFVPTKASEYVFSRLKRENCVTVVGSPGVGKTAVTRNVALKMERIGYTVIPITVATDIRHFYQNCHQTVFVIDDMCGNFTANKQMIDNWKQLLGFIDNILSDNCKIIVSCRSQVYKDKKFNVLAPFKSCECNIISNDLLLSKAERIKIAKAHLGKHGNDIQAANLLQYDFFPLLCFLYTLHRRQHNMDINEFFSYPFTVFEKDLNSLWNEGKVGQCKICGLALCVIYKNELDEKYLTGNAACVRGIIDDVCEACGINRGTSGIKIKDELDTLVGTYLKYENNSYMTVHDKLFDFLVYFCGKKMLDCLIKHGDSALVNERFHWNKLKERDTEFIVTIPGNKLTLYFNRLILDWSHGKVEELFSNNYNMKNAEFRDFLLNQLLHRDKAEQLKLARIAETKDGIKLGSFEACCWAGYANLLPWFLKQGVKINQCSSLTPLGAACGGNQIQMIHALLNLGADINKSGIIGCTPLHVSFDEALGADLAVLDLLLKYGACTDKRMFDGSTPLLLACLQNNREAVEKLLSNNADCDIGFYNMQAIKDGIKDVFKTSEFTSNVSELYWSGWFINKCPSSVVEFVTQEPSTLGCATPLHLMCFTNNVDMIRLLLEGNPDINKRKEDGSTPLFVACQFGFIDIVTTLLEYGANKNICTNDGISPFEIAKQRNHWEIISLLKNSKWKLDKSDKIKKKRSCTVL